MPSFCSCFVNGENSVQQTCIVMPQADCDLQAQRKAVVIQQKCLRILRFWSTSLLSVEELVPKT